jgi:large subunit ribosomal protein L25
MTITLPITLRDQTKKIAALRKDGQLPAVIYGSAQESVAITLNGKEFEKIVKLAGESTIIELTGLKNKFEVLIKEVDFDPIKSQIMHVDFYAVEQGKEMTTHVTLQFVGEAPAEKNNLGSVNKVLHEVEVTCLPSALPNHIDVDLSSLVSLESKIHIKDLVLPKGVKINAQDEDSVVVVSPLNELEVDEVVAPEVAPAEKTETK